MGTSSLPFGSRGSRNSGAVRRAAKVNGGQLRGGLLFLHPHPLARVPYYLGTIPNDNRVTSPPTALISPTSGKKRSRQSRASLSPNKAPLSPPLADCFGLCFPAQSHLLSDGVLVCKTD
ncbi:hypothetical protein CEXT_508881 [Caerostris extrusa]|uniref:Uncharacterized protein n=1 Tax=Caerostris extrusa TaxID=172846 RepID=A0AAV4MB89_CAEEX|nr:hypothetical protein CEXT_508881 [Caerostris extrusa]